MDKKIKITVLSENTAQGAGLLAEHGLAYWIEFDGRRVLFDTGQGGVLAHNAFRLGVQLRETDDIVLSHGHHDHTGGLPEALCLARHAVVHAHPAALQQRYVKEQDGTIREIGMPFPARRALHEHPQRLVKTEGPSVILPHLTITGPIPRHHEFESYDGRFFLGGDCSHPDPLDDDQAVYVQTLQGTLVLLGCAHAGPINTLDYVCQLTGSNDIFAVIGGLHLYDAPPERISQTIEHLKQFGIKRMAIGHCTGTAAMVAIWNAFPGQCSTLHVGARFEFPLP